MIKVIKAEETTSPAATGEVVGEAVETGGLPSTQAPASLDTFQLTDLPADLADAARAASDRIDVIHRRTVEGFAEIGREIMAVQEKLERGYFVKWLDTLPIARSSCYRAMEVAQKLGHKLPTVGKLGLTVAQKLAAAPEPVRMELLAALDGDDPPSSLAVDRRLKRAKREAEEAARDAKLTPEQRKRKAAKAARHQRELERHRAEWAENEARRKAKAQRFADIIVAHLPEELVEEVCQLAGGSFDHLPSRIDDARERDRQRHDGGDE